MADLYATLLDRIKDLGKLEAIDALLDWDQEVMMPSKGLEARAECAAFVAGLKHERRTSAEMGELLMGLDGETGDPVRDTNVRETRRRYQRAVNVPVDLVQELARTSSLAKEAWAAARRDNHFPTFAPLLSRLIELKRRQADAIGYETEPYDALLDEYEPGAKTAEVAAVFAELRRGLVPIVQAIAGVAAPRRPDFSILQRHYPRAGQERLARTLAEEMGFDFCAGRLDVSVHPFCTSMGGRDVRITTRYDERYMPAAVFGVMHEADHGLYEQGLDPAHVFTPMGTFCSLGIHESQSRLWENFVGRSRPFWERHYPAAQKLFPEALGSVNLDAFYAAINTVAPSLIRVEADEVTYNLHIVVRFELERDILNQKLEVADIPAAWNAKMEQLVGIRPSTDALGCLQDIHWSMGALGYFPTYALGNLYAAQFFAAARRAIPDLDERVRSGDLAALRDWLRTNIHRHGMRYRAGELCAGVTGQPLSTTPFLEYVRGKFGPIYGL